MHAKTLFRVFLCAIALIAPSLLPAASPTLEGSWQLTFIPTTPATPTTQIPGLATFTSDGSVIETDGSELVSSPVASPGHGIWQVAPVSTEFYVQYISVVVNTDGSLAGKNVTIFTGVTITTGSNSTTFNGNYVTDLVNPQGTVQTTAGKVHGVLIPHPLLP